MTIMKSNSTSLFVQDYAGGPVVYLGDVDTACFNLDSLPNPRGSIDPIYCLGKDGEIVVAATQKSGRDLLTFTIENLVGTSVNYLERLAERNCRFVFHAVQRCGGQAGVFSNRIRARSTWGNQFTDDMLGNVAQREATDAMTHTFEVTALSQRLDVWEILVAQKTTSEVQDANTIHSYVFENCGDDCGARADPCDVLVIGCDSTGAATANVLRSTDGGNTWTATAADPFTGVSEDITAIRMFPVGAATVRILCARNTDATAAGDVSYSDDDGATWTEVAYGSTNGEYVPYDQALCVIDESNIWLCTDQGNVYKSINGGVSWTVQGSAITASGGNALNAMDFADNNILVACGDSDTVIYSVDGGTNWIAATATGGANNLRACWAFDRYRWIVADDGGEMYQTWDGGATWTAMSDWAGYGTGTVTNMKFVSPLHGFMSHVDGSTVGRILQTIDGGNSWDRLQGDTGVAGLNAVHACSRNNCFAVGDDDTSTAVILQAGS